MGLIFSSLSQDNLQFIIIFYSYSVYTHRYTLYIVIHRQSVWLYHKFSVWLEPEDSSRRDQNTAGFTLVEYLTPRAINVSKYIFYKYLFTYMLSATGVLNSWEEQLHFLRTWKPANYPLECSTRGSKNLLSFSQSRAPTCIIKIFSIVCQIKLS